MAKIIKFPAPETKAFEALGIEKKVVRLEGRLERMQRKEDEGKRK